MNITMTKCNGTNNTHNTVCVIVHFWCLLKKRVAVAVVGAVNLNLNKKMYSATCK